MRYKVMAVLFLIFVGAGYWWSHRTDPAEVAAVGSKRYICPMHPQIHSDRPGSCSICGMDLVLEMDGEGEEDHDHRGEEGDTVGERGSVRLSTGKRQMIGIVTASVEKKKLFKSIRLPGRVAFDPELYTAQSEYLNALKQWRKVRKSPSPSVVENTRQMIQSSKIRLKVLGLSEGQIQELKRKGTQTEGLLVSGRGQDNWIYADVFEMDLPWIKKGLKAEVSGGVLQGKVLEGEVVSVDQVINPHTRTAKVRIRLVGERVSLRPESYVEVSILSPLGDQVAVPREAVMDTGRDVFVFVKKEKGRFVPRKISILMETDQYAAVAKGVSPGEEVVVGGNFMLDSESRLRAVIP